MRTVLRVSAALVILFVGSVPGRVSAQSPAASVKDDAEVKAALVLVEAQLAAFRHDEGIPALSAAVVYDQDILWAKGFGFTDLDGKVPTTPQTVYRVHSISKLFTATMLMQLRDRGKLQLDDPVANYLPGFAPKSRFGDLPPITLRQLASHTSGLQRLPPLPVRDLSMETILSGLKDVEQTFPLLTEWKYSNLGYMLLGYALSRIAGQPYDEYVQENILKPLGMNHSGFVVTPEMERYVCTADLPHKGEKLRKVALDSRASFGAPAFGLYSSVEDIARFISLHFRDQQEPAGGTQVLRGSSLREMRAPQWLMPDPTEAGVEAIGIGFGIRRVGGHVAIGHGGGYRTFVLLVPATKLGIAIFTNGPRGRLAEAASVKALEFMIPVIERAVARQKPPAPTSPPAAWQEYIGLYEAGTGRHEIRLVGDRLVLLDADRALADIELVPEGEHRFRLKAGFFKGELVVFEMDPAGKVVRMRYADRLFTRK